MSVSEKLVTIAQNEQRVYDAGYRKGLETSGGGGVVLPELSAPAVAENILDGKEAVDKDGNKLTGKMPNIGLWTYSATPENTPPGSPIWIPKGYHDGNGAVSINYAAFKAFGEEMVKNEWWSAYQNGGARTDYSYAFAGAGWNDTTFAPRHNINAAATTSMFRASQITDLKGILERQGVSLNVTQAVPADYFASGSTITRFPEFGIALTNISNAFNGCRYLVSIDKINMSTAASCACTNTFNNCSALVDIRFNAGINPASLKLTSSSKLSKASFASNNEDGKGYGLIPALADGVTGSVSVNNVAVNAAFTEEEWTALCATKSTWTITRV